MPTKPNCREAIKAALAGGPKHRDDIVFACRQWKAQTVSNNLFMLGEAGEIRRVGVGVYELFSRS